MLSKSPFISAQNFPELLFYQTISTDSFTSIDFSLLFFAQTKKFFLHQTKEKINAFDGKYKFYVL
jgi:hypothetical protein